MVSSMVHAPNVSVNNSNFRLAFDRELERKYPLVVREFARRVDPWIVRFCKFVKSLWKRICDFFLYS